jgi:hypothetical protein
VLSGSEEEQAAPAPTQPERDFSAPLEDRRGRAAVAPNDLAHAIAAARSALKPV